MLSKFALKLTFCGVPVCLEKFTLGTISLPSTPSNCPQMMLHERNWFFCVLSKCREALCKVFCVSTSASLCCFSKRREIAVFKRIEPIPSKNLKEIIFFKKFGYPVQKVVEQPSKHRKSIFHTLVDLQLPRFVPNWHRTSPLRKLPISIFLLTFYVNMAIVQEEIPREISNLPMYLEDVF